MNLLDYKKVEPSQVAREISKILKLGWSDQEKIEEHLRNEYTIVEFPKRKKSNPFLLKSFHQNPSCDSQLLQRWAVPLLK